MAERSKTWISRGGTARSADPVHGGRGAEKLLENLRRLGADDWMIRSVEESSRNGRRTSRTASAPRPATPR